MSRETSLVISMEDSVKNNKDKKRGPKNKPNMRKLRISLKYRPEIYNLIVKMQQSIKKKMRLIREMRRNLKNMVCTLSKFLPKLT